MYVYIVAINDYNIRIWHMKLSLFNFCEKEGRYIYKDAIIECKVTFKLMLRLKRYLRESPPEMRIADAIMQWHLELDSNDKKDATIGFELIKTRVF